MQKRSKLTSTVFTTSELCQIDMISRCVSANYNCSISSYLYDSTPIHTWFFFLGLFRCGVRQGFVSS